MFCMDTANGMAAVIAGLTRNLRIVLRGFGFRWNDVRMTRGTG
jgi:hypothetical protein